ncbi:hypothetical protein [Streptomyces sp. NPDC002851]
MGITSAWAVTAHDDEFIGELAPRTLPLLEATRADPVGKQRWRRWERQPLPDYRSWGRSVGREYAEQAEAIDSFHRMVIDASLDDLYHGGAGPDDGFWLPDVWEQANEVSQMFLSVQSKDYAVCSLFHAIGPRRAAQIPGWCGNFLLTSAQVRESLPQVEEALGFTVDERAAAEDQDWLGYSADEESVLDGPSRMWREAAAEGLGLCGVSLHIY